MPDPICSSSSSTLCEPPLVDSQEANACVPNASASTEGNTCPVSGDPSSGTSLLTAKFENKNYAAFIESQTPPRDGGSDSGTAQWFVGHASSVADPSGMMNNDAANGSLVTYSRSGLEAKGLYGSVQAGRQFDVQAGVEHLAEQSESFGFHVSGSLDVATVRANLGSENDDGSEGVNVGAMATAVGAEVTLEQNGTSVTMGASASLGIAFSSGAGRDVDGDGIPERCFKGSLGPLTLGVCTEW